MNQLYRKEFVWFVPNDDNRIIDGHEVRDEFLSDEDIHNLDETWIDLGCSMLEMLIALARRVAFLEDEDARDWFWILVKNAGITDCNDRAYRDNPHLEHTIDHILDRVIWRKYEYNGEGGLFPLRNPERDQRQVELWYQLSAYLNEREEGSGWTSTGS